MIIPIYLETYENKPKKRLNREVFGLEMGSKSETIACIPLSKSSAKALNQPVGALYDTLDRFNSRTESVESGIGFSNDGCDVFEEEDAEENTTNFQINDAYSSLGASDFPPPPTPSLPRPLNPDTYEDLNKYNKAQKERSSTDGGHQQSYERMYSMPEIQPQTNSNKKTLQRQKKRLNSSPQINGSNPQREQHQMNEEFRVDMKPCYTLPSLPGGLKKQNLLYESSLTTKTKTKIDRSSNNKVQIMKTNSTSTLKATTGSCGGSVCGDRGAGRKRICGIPQRQCFMALNIIFGVCAIAALTIGVVLIFHQQANKNDKKEFVKEGIACTVYCILFIQNLLLS